MASGPSHGGDCIRLCIWGGTGRVSLKDSYSGTLDVVDPLKLRFSSIVDTVLMIIFLRRQVHNMKEFEKFTHKVPLSGFFTVPFSRMKSILLTLVFEGTTFRYWSYDNFVKKTETSFRRYKEVPGKPSLHRLNPLKFVYKTELCYGPIMKEKMIFWSLEDRPKKTMSVVVWRGWWNTPRPSVFFPCVSLFCLWDPIYIKHFHLI